MKKLLLVALLALTAVPAYGDSTTVSNLQGLGMPGELASEIDKSYAGTSGTSGQLSTTGSVIFRNSTGTPKAFVTAATGGASFADISGTTGSLSGDLTFSGAGAGPKFPAPGNITPATSFPTPAGAGQLSARVNLIVAGAPTAAFVQLPAATANVGETFNVYSASSNPVAIVPISGDTANAAAAATPYNCAAGKWCDCFATTTGTWVCTSR